MLRCVKILTSDVFLQHLFGIVAPVVATHHADTEWRQQGATPDVSYRRRPEAVGQYTARFFALCVSARLIANEVPLLIEFTDKSNIKVSNGDEVIWRGESFKVRMAVLIPVFSILTVSREFVD